MGLRSEEAVASSYPFHLDLVGFLPLHESPLSQAWIQVYSQFFLQLPCLQAGGDETRHQCMISTYREHNHLEGLISCLYRLCQTVQTLPSLAGHNNELTMYMWVGFPRTLLRPIEAPKSSTVLRRRSSNSPFPFSDMSTLAQPLFTHANDRPCVPRFVRIWQAEPCLVCSL